MSSELQLAFNLLMSKVECDIICQMSWKADTSSSRRSAATAAKS